MTIIWFIVLKARVTTSKSDIDHEVLGFKSDAILSEALGMA